MIEEGLCQVNCKDGPCDRLRAKDWAGHCCLLCFDDYVADCAFLKGCLKAREKRRGSPRKVPTLFLYTPLS